MNRILKRPMFRMGGRSDDGIMSMRPGFKTGASVPGSILGQGFQCLQEDQQQHHQFQQFKDFFHL